MNKIPLTLTLLFMMLSGLAQNSTRTFEHEGTTYSYEKLNEVERPLALLVLFDGGAGIAARISPETAIPDSAVAYQYQVIGIDQGDFFITADTYARISTIIDHVRQEQGIEQNLFLGGFSIGGFTAIRFAEMAAEKEDANMIPQAIFGVDPPLDHLAFVDYCHRELARTCPNEEANQLGKGEAEWLLGYYQQHFGSHTTDASTYIANSCFTASMPTGGNGIFLQNIPLNMIHEIDLKWLIEERCRDLSDTNAYISSKFVNYLVAQGNAAATITLTNGIGYRADGRRHPHSWSIADPIVTLDWLSKYMLVGK